MAEFPEKIEQSEKYPDETTSVVLGNCYDKKVTAEIVRRYNSHGALVEACRQVRAYLIRWPDAKHRPYIDILDKAAIAAGKE